MLNELKKDSNHEFLNKIIHKHDFGKNNYYLI